MHSAILSTFINLPFVIKIFGFFFFFERSFYTGFTVPGGNLSKSLKTHQFCFVAIIQFCLTWCFTSTFSSHDETFIALMSTKQRLTSSKIFFTDRSKSALLLWIVYVISVLFLLCSRARLFIDALWSPAGKGMTSWLSFVMSNCKVVAFPLVSWVRCGAWLNLDLCPLSYFAQVHSTVQPT